MGIYILSILGVIVLIFKCHKDEVDIKQYITPGIVLYLFGIVLLLLVSNGLYRKEWDEYSHWGLAVKDMFYYDIFSKHIGSSVIFKRYPPFSTLIEYFFMYNNGIFSEKIMYIAYLAMTYSFLIIILKNITWKRVIDMLWGIVIIMLIPPIFFGHIYSLYIDFMLMALFAYVLVCYLDSEMSKFNVFRMVGGVSALVLAKEMGLILAGVIWLSVLLDILFSKSERNVKKRKYTIVGIMFMAIVFVFVSWQVYINVPVEKMTDEFISKNSSVSSLAASGISVEGIKELLCFEAPEYKYNVIKLYFKEMIIGNTYFLGNISFSYLGIILICILITVYLKKQKITVDRLVKILTLVSVSSVFYATFLLVTYLFAFSESEALILASHERYLAPAVGGILMAFCSWLFMNIKEKDVFTIVLAICCAILVGIPYQCMIPEHIDTYIDKDIFVEVEKVEEVVRTFADRDESIYYICNNGGGVPFVVFRNAVSPMNSSPMGTQDIYESDVFKKRADLMAENEKILLDKGRIISVEEWKEELIQYDYVYLDKIAPVFIEAYEEIFESKEIIEHETFYRVDKQKEGIVLSYLAELN